MKEILPALDMDSVEPLYLQLYKYIRKEIELGNIAPGDKLPSIRSLSAKLGISITTVRTAYDQLSMEGYILSRDKSGYLVNALDMGDSAKVSSSPQKAEDKENQRHDNIYDERCFDFVKWKKCLSYTMIYNKAHLLAEADYQGEYELREQVARYVFQSRGVHCSSEDIVIGAGTQQLLMILSALLKKQNKKTIGIENPGYFLSENIFSSQGFEICHLPLDKEGVQLSQDQTPKLDLLYVSPSHQFPTGIVMSASRRSNLLSWASQDQGGYIIEDDYDSELRYFGRPVPALKAMDKNDRVIYMGSFASTLLPSIRISYLVLPKELLLLYKNMKNAYSQGVSIVDQLTLCQFIQDGHYQRHIRRIRRIYSEKSAVLSEFIKKTFGDNIKIISNTSGLFMILQIQTKSTEQELAMALREEGIKATPYGSYEKREYSPKERLLLLYFYNIKTGELMEILEKVFWNLRGAQEKPKP